MDPILPAAAPPAGLRVERSGTETRVSWRWFSWRAVYGLLFMTVWDAVLGFVFFSIASSGSLARLDAGARASLLAMAAFAFAANYIVAVHLVDRTTVTLDAARVRVETGPLPWFGDRELARADIAGVVLAELHDSDPDDLTPPTTYSVKVTLKGGATRALAMGLSDGAHAAYLARLLAGP